MAAANPPHRLVGLFCLVTLLPNIALGQPSSSPPTEVWIRGSDIPTPEHLLTQRLRGALEGVIGATLRPRADREQTIVWLPEDVQIEGNSFEYRAVITDKQFNVSRSSTGECDKRKLNDCAKEILRALAKP